MDDSDDEADQVASEGLRFGSREVLTLKPILVSFVNTETNLKNKLVKQIKTGSKHCSRLVKNVFQEKTTIGCVQQYGFF